jgi:hypothetical protein
MDNKKDLASLRNFKDFFKVFSKILGNHGKNTMVLGSGKYSTSKQKCPRQP